MKIEESIKKLKYMADFGRDVCIKQDETEAIETVLEELEKNTDRINELINEVTIKDAELEKKDKVINEMAKEIIEKTLSKDDWCHLLNNQGCKENDTCLKCLKEYFEKKVSEENAKKKR